MVYVMGLVLLRVVEQEQDNQVVVKITEALDDLRKRMVNCEFMHFELASYLLLYFL